MQKHIRDKENIAALWEQAAHIYDFSCGHQSSNCAKGWA